MTNHRMTGLLFALFVLPGMEVAYRTNYEDLGESYAMNEEKPNIENDVDSVGEEENSENFFSISHEKRKEKDEKTSLKRIPDKLIRQLKMVKSFSEVEQILGEHSVKEDEEDVVEKRRAASDTTSLICPIPRNTTVTTLPVAKNTRPIKLYSEPGCKPVPVVVKFTPPADGYYYPSATTIHRCIGSCFQGHLYQCEVTEEQEIKYKVYKLTHFTGAMVEIKAMNHTGCACGCIIKESHCDPVKMRYDPDACSCDCIEDESSCDPAIKKWIPEECSCKCKYPQRKCPPKNRWNTTICACKPYI